MDHRFLRAFCALSLAFGVSVLISSGAEMRSAGADCPAYFATKLAYLRADPYNKAAGSGRRVLYVGATTNAPAEHGAMAGSGWVALVTSGTERSLVGEEFLMGHFSLRRSAGATPAAIDYDITIDPRTAAVTITQRGSSTPYTFTGRCEGAVGMTGTVQVKQGAMWTLTFRDGTVPQ